MPYNLETQKLSEIFLSKVCPLELVTDQQERYFLFNLPKGDVHGPVKGDVFIKRSGQEGFIVQGAVVTNGRIAKRPDGSFYHYQERETSEPEYNGYVVVWSLHPPSAEEMSAADYEKNTGILIPGTPFTNSL